MSDSRHARRQVRVNLKNGLHLVPCSMIVKLVRGFPGEVRIQRDTMVADAASVFDLLGLNAQDGTELTLEANGEGADLILDQLVTLFEHGFELGR